MIITKRLTSAFALIFSLLLFASAGLAQQTDTRTAQKKQQMMKMMQDSTMRTMMMEQMAQNPEVRKQMMVQGDMMDGKGMMDKDGMKSGKDNHKQHHN